MKQFNVINYNFNKQVMELYDVIPYLVDRYNECDNQPKTFDEFKKFVEKESKYQWWARTEYEIIISNWPSQKHEEKWDIYKQISMNINIVTNLLMESV